MRTSLLLALLIAGGLLMAGCIKQQTEQHADRAIIYKDSNGSMLYLNATALCDAPIPKDFPTSSPLGYVIQSEDINVEHPIPEPAPDGGNQPSTSSLCTPRLIHDFQYALRSHKYFYANPPNSTDCGEAITKPVLCMNDTAGWQKEQERWMQDYKTYLDACGAGT